MFFEISSLIHRFFVTLEPMDPGMQPLQKALQVAGRKLGESTSQLLVATVVLS